MKLILRGFYFFLVISIVLIVLEYSKSGTYNWLENMLNALVFAFFYSLFSWFFNSFRKKEEK